MTKKEEKLYHNRLVYQMYPYLVSAKRALGITKCERCNGKAITFHHLRYAKDINIHDIQYICKRCHDDIYANSNDSYIDGSSVCPCCLQRSVVRI